MNSYKINGLLLAAVLSGVSVFALPDPDQVILSKPYEFGKKAGKAEAPRFDAHFSATANAAEVTLQLDHHTVMHPWQILVNDQPVGQLGRSYKDPGKTFVPVPAGGLKNGQNTLSFVGEDFANRNAVIEKAALFGKPMRELFRLRSVAVTVTDDETGQPVPARISIINDRGQGADIFHPTGANYAQRKGMIYTKGDRISLELPAGRYQFFATRGMEWSRARQTISLGDPKGAQVDLRIRRQVDTRGFVAADTHIHTITFSGHGDASVEERMLTLAGEGVELAVATDHNHFTDYTPFQAKLELNPFFTPVTGNEVTTKNGHFCAFPFQPGGAVPDHHQDDWVKLVADIRAKGARAVIWNHPYYPNYEDSAYTKFRFNRASGDRFNGPAFHFNAMELVNSSSSLTIARDELKNNPMRLFNDWFAILNRGEKITAVGASDTHTVEGPVGQGRTYIRSSMDDAARLNVDELVGSFLAGDTSVGYGIFAEASVNQSRRMGEMIRPVDGKAEVEVRVAAADWIKPRRAIIFLNGLPVAEKKLSPKSGKPFDQRLKFSVKTPPHDAYLVCAVFGDGVREPYWPTLAKFTAAIANPIYVDSDGNGQFQFPRATAKKMLAASDSSLKSVWALLEKSDDAMAGQMLGLLYLERDADFVKQLDSRVRAAAPGRELYRTFLDRSPLIVVDAKALKTSDSNKPKQ